jgi:asparagine synthase (glutamine-hydrolysing)
MLLRYEDRNSMAHSVESRVPFLTRSLVEFIYALPEEYLIAPDGTSKSIFRQAMRGIVPDAILDRRDKIGFATPERSWLGSLKPWVEEVFASDAARSIPALNLSHVRREWVEILEGKRSFDFRVWRWLNLIRWTEQFKVEF